MPAAKLIASIALTASYAFAHATVLTAQTGSMRVTVPSPTAASLGKFGDVPVSLYTGVPDVSIPLFTAKGRTLDLPITLRYHAAGVRVEDTGGWAGLGWALEAGGVITRTVRGLVDEKGAGYYNTGHVFYNDANWPTPTITTIQNIASKQLDGEPDRFHFSFAGRSGQFVMGPTTTSPSIKDYRAIPHQKLRIVPVFSFGDIAQWEVTTEDGTRYTFGAVETTTDYTTMSPAETEESGPSHYGEAHTSSWHLTEIRAPGGDVVSLYYSSYAVRHRQGRYSERFSHISSNGTNACVPQAFDVINEYAINVQRLDSIKAAAHTVKFSAALRSDALSPTNQQQEYRLDRITVTTPTGTQLRRFQFEHDYFAGNRLRLKAVYEQDPNGASLPPHSFTYDAQSLPHRTSFAMDHWGYYNGEPNTTSIPAMLSPFGFSLSGADRRPVPSFMKAGVLTRITYPMGGYNEFVYEANDYGATANGATLIDDGSPQTAYLSSSGGQGFRSAQFTIEGTSTITATIEVNLSPSGCGEEEWPPCPWVELVGHGQYQPGAHLVQLAPGTYTLQASDEGMATGTAQIIVGWRDRAVTKKKTAGGLRVAEVHTADAMGNVATRRYKYTLQSDTARSSGIIAAEPAYSYSYSSSQCSYFSRSSMSKIPLGDGPVLGYREVTVWNGANAQYGRTRYTFRSIADAPDVRPYSWPFAPPTSYEWARGHQTGNTEYDALGRVQQRSASIYAFRQASADSAKSFRGMSITAFSAGQLGSNYLYHPFEVMSAWTHLTADTTFIHDETGASALATVTAYAYDNPAHLQVTQTTETNSDNKQRITRMKYPADYASGAGNAEASAIAAMRGVAHIHAAVIERWVSDKVGTTERVLQGDLTSFRQYASGQYLPHQRFVLNATGPVANYISSTVSGSFTKDIRYLLQESANTYDAFGRVTQLADARGKLTNYQYGGNINNAFLTKVTRAKDATGAVDLVTDLAYDMNGNLASIKDEGGTFRNFSYDLFGRLAQIKNHSNTLVTAYGYQYSRTSGNNWVFQNSSPNLVTTTVYLQHSPSVKAIVTRDHLDGLGRSIQHSTEDGSTYHVTAQQYDGMGRSWRTWKPYPRTSSAYDPSFSSNATSWYNTYHATSSAKPYRDTEYTADALSRVKREIPEYIGTAASAFRQYAFGIDAVAKQSYTETTDEVGKKNRQYTDLFGNDVKTIMGYGATEASTTTFAYDVLGQRAQATDPRGLVTTYAPNTRGLLVSRASPDAGTVSHLYDQAGHLRYTQDANQAAAGQVHFTTYDFAGRALTSGVGTATFSILNPDAPSAPALETTQANWRTVWTYDAKPTNAFPWSLFWTQISPLTLSNVTGRVAAVASAANGVWQVTLYSYDTDGRVATRYVYTQANDGSVLAALNTTVTYTRDLRDAVIVRALRVGANTFNHWYDFDGRGLLWKAYATTLSTKPATPDVTYTYRPGGAVEGRQYAGGALVPMRHTIREELERIGDPSTTSYPFSGRYAYHANGMVSEAEFYSAGTPVSTKRYKYAYGAASYDALNRLKSADYSFWSGSAWTSTLALDLTGITYDRTGNLTGLQRYKESGALIDNLTYAYPAASNRLSSVTDAISGNAETWDAKSGSFTYDPNGNLKTAPAPYSVTAATYDHRNLPLSLTRSGVTTSYRYDHAGQRITKDVGGGNTEVYVLDGPTTLVVYTVNGSGGVISSSSFFNVIAGARVVGRQPGTGAPRRYYHTDMLGSTRAVVEGNTVVESYDFDPWGLLLPGRTLGGGTKEGFTGKERDAESGLDYFGSRHYMAAIGRWSSVDPAAGSFPAWSPYNYVLGNPTGAVDPDGEVPWLVTGAIGASVEFAIQVAVARSQNQSWGDAVSGVDVSDIVAAGVVSAATGGLSVFKTGSAAARIAKLSAVSVVEGKFKAHFGSATQEYGAVDAVIDVAAPMAIGRLTDQAVGHAKKSVLGRDLARQLRKATNIAADGGPRPAQTRKKLAAERRADIRKWVGVQAMEAAATGSATTVIQAQLNGQVPVSTGPATPQPPVVLAPWDCHAGCKPPR